MGMRRGQPLRATFSFKGKSYGTYFLIMSIPRLGTIILGMAIVSCFGQNDSARTIFSRRAIIVGPLFAYDARDAYIDISDIQKSVPVHRSGILAFGLAAGMQAPVSPAVRLQIGLNLDAGSALDDTLFTAETVTVRNFYYHAGLEPQLHVALWRSRSFAPFLCAGAGVNCVWVQERTFLLHDPGKEILYTDRKYVSTVSLSFDLLVGLGCDIAINNRFGIFLSDCFRYLYPVSYKVNQDFPLYEMPYREALYGNVFCLGISIGVR
jgi:hypothetical protein